MVLAANVITPDQICVYVMQLHIPLTHTFPEMNERLTQWHTSLEILPQQIKNTTWPVKCYNLCNDLSYAHSFYSTYKYLLIHLLTYSIKQNPSWEANWFSAKQETPRILYNPKVHYHIHKCLPPAPILSQLNPVYTPTSHFLKLHLNIILLSTIGSPKCRFLAKTL